mgnify:CR=1 FL=1|jgi:hypothetical protein
MQIEKDQPITTVEELQSVIKEITMENTALDFKWRFVVEPVPASNSYVYSEHNHCLESASQGWFVQVEFQRPDTATGEMGIGRSRKEFVAKGTWVSGLVKTCWLLLELTVRHELMEAFHWRNKRIFNPHNSVFDLARIQ